MFFFGILFLVFSITFINGFGFEEVWFENGAVFLLCTLIVGLGNGVGSFIEVKRVNIGAVVVSGGGV